MSTSENTNKKVFLVTTAIEEFWDTSENNIFLGSWCFINDKNSITEKRSVRTLASPYVNADLIKTYTYLNNKFEEILPILSITLNKIHGESYSEKYWRILIGPWLKCFIHVMFDRFSLIEKSLNDYPNFTTFLLDKDNYITPLDTKDFNNLLANDPYNLQIFSKILKFLGKDFPEKKLKVSFNKSPIEDFKSSLKTKLLFLIQNLLINISSFFHNKNIYCFDSYLPRLAEIKLMLASYGKIIFVRSRVFKVNKNQIEINLNLRDNLLGLNFGDCIFSKCISSLIFLEIPKVFIENYSLTKKTSVKIFPKNTAMIASSNTWFTTDVFKFWAAGKSENGVLLLGLQHGGIDYGARECLHYRDHETSIVDYYFSWGWKDNKCKAEIIPMPANKLINENDINSSDLETDILWVTSSKTRYLKFFPITTSYFEKYLDFQTKFISNIDKAYIKNLKIRTSTADYGWGIRFRLKVAVKNIRFDNNNTPYYKSLKKCRLCVVDYLSTTATEALALNKPVILFWSNNEINNTIRGEYVKYFDLLRSVGILYNSPEAAARAVNKVYNNVDLWWSNKKRKKAVFLVNKIFAIRSNNGLSLWKDTIIKISNSS